MVNQSSEYTEKVICCFMECHGKIQRVLNVRGLTLRLHWTVVKLIHQQQTYNEDFDDNARWILCSNFLESEIEMLVWQ